MSDVLHCADMAVLRDFRRPVALVVGDSAAERRLLRLQLSSWNFVVLDAVSGSDALAICRSRTVDFVLCDWSMPGMDGLALCRAIRALPLPGYIYLILLTSRHARGSVAEGLEAGADDFLSKPADADELHARLRAGERILAMQEDLLDKNHRLTEAFDRLGTLHEAVDRDLRAAARLQRGLVPVGQSRCGGAEVGALWLPAGHVGGDLVGLCELGPGRIAAWAIDVSGHGVASALTAVRVAQLFRPGETESPALRLMPSGARIPRDPADVAAELNRRLSPDVHGDGQYLTLLYADIDLSTGLIRFVQAGHPPPAVLRRCGTVERPGAGGLPIGLLTDAVWETETVRLDQGEQFVLLSDGITEVVSPTGESFETAALPAALTRRRDLPEAEMLNELRSALEQFAETARSEDDISALVVTIP